MLQDDNEFFYNDEFQSLLAEYETAVKEGLPILMDADELTDIAEYYMTIFKEKQANRAISTALEMYPESIDPWIFVARQHLFYGKIKEAEQICESLIDQEDREVLFLRAEILIKKGKPRTACKLFLQETAKMEEDKDMFLFDCAQVFEDYQAWEEAHMFARLLIKEYPDYPKAKILEAEIFLNECDYQQAITLLQDIIDSDPYNIQAWNMLAESYLALGMIEEATDSIEFVLAIEKNNKNALTTKANCLLIQERSEEAHNLYLQVIEKIPVEAKVYYLDSVALTNMQCMQEASSQIKKAIKACYGQPDELIRCYTQQAYIEGKRHNLDFALKSLEKAQTLSLENFISINYNLIKGEILITNGKKEEAMLCFKKAIEESEDSLHTKLMIGTSLGEQGFYPEVEKLLTSVISEYGDDAKEAYAYLAFCYVCMQDYEKFLTYLKLAIKKDINTTKTVFQQFFPSNVSPEMYYPIAYWNIKGEKPDNWDNNFQIPNINFNNN